MSFLDNLENAVKAEEARASADPEQHQRDIAARHAEQEAARASEPYSEALRKGAFTQDLLKHCRIIGHSKRILVRFTWLDTTLRLEARSKRMELTPLRDGVRAVFSEDGVEQGTEVVDLSGDAESLARRWLEAL